MTDPSPAAAPAQGRWPAWLYPTFFGAHVGVTALLIPWLRVRDPLYHAIPWIFAAALLLSLLPPVGRRLAGGTLPWRLAPLALYAAVITLASSVNPRATTGVSGNVFHPVEYAGLALLALLGLQRGPKAPVRPARLALVVLGCALFGMLDELHQRFVPRRSSSIEDVLLDTLGALAGALLFVTGARLLRRVGARSDPL